MSDPNHPVWKLFTLMVCCATVLGILYVSCSHFDITEIAAFTAIIPVIISAVYSTNILKTLTGSRQE